MNRLMLAAAALALSAGMGMAQTVRIATEGAYPPYNLVNDAGEVDGFEVELGNELCKRAELDCTWVKNDWDSIISNLNSSNYDAIMAGMSITEERKQSVAFTQNYIPPTASAYAAPDAGVDVTTAVVAAQISTIQAQYVAESGARLLEFATPDEAVGAVRDGQAEAVFADRDFLVPIVNESNGAMVWVEGQDNIPLGEGIGMALRQSDTELKAKFDAAITSMKDDGTLNQLISKWFGEEGVLY
ncbi:amino acid ABC transporter substrate-binding protein, PAAT family (TC 3.A.1.3.-) [Paracoccus halophilus]|uniref:Amino acid ABC transporter n=1 Tax=Paracoccus halophilus TaxID=376733 RepID=A0A099EWS6_9RHOB|nr:transporter substrate-binding domain-containing protein [Paracoccus halophilus]KGJ02436.1 amino acid ABC transporter [Paracoccus halophilus]SFA61227.1 amino acid ABC transporter substrate-binding protein, PAAT family (TC 3.A.1.3.-) [Paracoccus halophilus]